MYNSGMTHLQMYYLITFSPAFFVEYYPRIQVSNAEYMYQMLWVVKHWHSASQASQYWENDHVQRHKPKMHT